MLCVYQKGEVSNPENWLQNNTFSGRWMSRVTVVKGHQVHKALEVSLSFFMTRIWAFYLFYEHVSTGKSTHIYVHILDIKKYIDTNLYRDGQVRPELCGHDGIWRLYLWTSICHLMYCFEAIFRDLWLALLGELIIFKKMTKLPFGMTRLARLLKIAV